MKITKKQRDWIFREIDRDISDRRGIKWEWTKIDADVLRVISKSWKRIVEDGLSENEPQ